MGRRFLFELLQDRTFLLFLHGFSGLPGKQIGQTGIDPIHNQIGAVAGSAAVLRHGNGFCPGFIVLRDPPVTVLVPDCVGENKLYPFRSEFPHDFFHSIFCIQPVVPIMIADSLFNGFLTSAVRLI